MKTLCLVALLLTCLLQAYTLPDDPQASLFKAIRSGNVAEVERTLAAVPNLNSREVVPTKPRLDDPSDKKEMLGDTPLMIATQEGGLELVKLLLAHGADVNASGEAGSTPLMEGIRYQHSDLAVLLLEKGAKPNQRNIHGDTAIVFAANEGNAPLIITLLDHRADINGGTGWTPLMDAAYNGRENIVVLLLKKGANVNLRRGNMMTPLECALVQHNDDIAALLRKAGGKGRSAAVLAQDNEKYQAKWLKEAGMDAAQLQAKALRFRKERLLTPEDQTVIETAMTDMLAYQGKDGFLAHPAQQDIALINITAVGPWLFSDDQLNGELDVAQANDVTRDMREHLQQRNWVSTSLTDFKPRNTHILLVDEKRVDNRLDNLPNDYPHIQAWVRICLPGYSKLRDAVVLRFTAGPSAHGMAGTYFLIKSQGRWQVKWRCFAHYV
jgi:ankyrin repeat protein